MENQTTTINQEYDAKDTVWYGRHKKIEYYDPDTKKYMIFAGKGASRIWKDLDYSDLMDHKLADEGRLMRLIRSVDADNIITIKDKHTHQRRAASSIQDLMDITDCKKRSWTDFKGKLDRADIMAYGEITLADETHKRFYINPIYTMGDRKITLTIYKLFQESLDRVLPNKAKENLQRHWEEEFGGDNTTTDQLPEPINVLDNDSIYIPEDPSMDIFARTVLAGKDLKCYDADNWGMAHNPKSNENVFFLVQESDTGKRTQNDITAYRNIAIDIDFGKDSDGEYIKDGDAIDERKMVVWNELRRVLPTPTAVVDSRNGFHMYWSIQKTEIREEWDCLATYVKDVLAGIIDPTVTCDSARVLRMPGSIHRKEGLMAYDVELLETNDIIYDTAELTSAFAAAVDGIAAAKESILAQIPDMITKKPKKAAIAGRNDVVPEDVSARIEAIRNLSMDTFEVAEPTEMEYQQNSEYLRHLDLAEFLQLPVGISVECVLHQNKPGHKSATIYAPDDRADNWRYICHCQSKPLDIVGVVMALADCTAGEAYRYLNGVYGITVVRISA